MSHTLTNLETIVKNHNDASLNDLWQSKRWLFASRPPFQTTPSQQASVSSSLASAPIPGSTPPPGPSIGTLRGSACTLPCLVQNALCNAPSQNMETVFSIVDSNSSQDDLQVVLCVGINYGQFHGPNGGPSHTVPTLLSDNTKMRPHVADAFKHAGLTPPIFHLVATNFFPWITNLRWVDSINGNSIKEALLMNACGYDDPIQIISSLVNAIKPEFLIFHGANNCVPSLAPGVHHTSIWKNRVTILCDNLSAHAKWSNSVVLP